MGRSFVWPMGREEVKRCLEPSLKDYSLSIMETGVCADAGLRERAGLRVTCERAWVCVRVCVHV